MIITGTSEPGNPDKPNEDWAAATPTTMVVLDGATVRTETGCTHGVPWYTASLGARLLAPVRNDAPLPDALAEAITAVNALHPDCDLTHPGTPSAAVGLVRIDHDMLEWLVLGDVTLVLDTIDGLQIVCDDRVSKTAAAQRAEVDRYLIGSPEKARALIPMKHAELAARNREGGYWIAATDPTVGSRALTGQIHLDTVRQVALLTDGATRAVNPFGLHTWSEILHLAHSDGPHTVIRAVRAAELNDPLGAKYPRNKASDDATLLTVTWPAARREL